jgi:RimJ/RimL family protein N-acetyltransferase
LRQLRAAGKLVMMDAASFQAFRLAALQEAPTAFGSSFEEEKDPPSSVIEGRLAIKADRGPVGAFEEGQLIGLVALSRENLKNVAHEALIWGMYVKPEHRGKDIAKTLLQEALCSARSVPEVLQVNLSVNSRNTAAIRLYESFGFKVFGHEPGAMRINGELHDELHTSLRLTDA